MASFNDPWLNEKVELMAQIRFLELKLDYVTSELDAVKLENSKLQALSSQGGELGTTGS